MELQIHHKSGEVWCSERVSCSARGTRHVNPSVKSNALVHVSKLKKLCRARVYALKNSLYLHFILPLHPVSCFWVMVVLGQPGEISQRDNQDDQSDLSVTLTLRTLAKSSSSVTTDRSRIGSRDRTTIISKVNAKDYNRQIDIQHNSLWIILHFNARSFAWDFKPKINTCIYNFPRNHENIVHMLTLARFKSVYRYCSHKLGSNVLLGEHQMLKITIFTCTSLMIARI